MAEAANEPYSPDEPSRLLLAATMKALHDWRKRRHVPESVTTEELAEAGEMARIMLQHGDASDPVAAVQFDPPDSAHEDDGVEPEELETLRAEIRARRDTLPAGPL
ncbi:MAG TPA: hypothetical protein VJN29_17405 [Intrasporangium sp.]|uniref:hypothetical protein n=1 Tax=Intrasporangium sp. TaxID=1925024 RepID=UPI002B49E40D|nr:hypothetical protein [Intrasporangium sp.]HKX68995.1 hypothetical protein [Intrasporangium sp.]